MSPAGVTNLMASAWREDLWRLLTLQDSNTRTVLLGAGLLGLTAGVVGTLAMLRRRALVGDAISHAALPGICVAYLIAGERQFWVLLVGALVMGTVAAWSVSFVRSATRIKEDAALAVAIGAFFGLGIVLSRVIQSGGGRGGAGGGNRAGLDGFIFGKAASMVRSDVVVIAGVCAVVLAVVAGLGKEFRLAIFDREFAHAQGWPVRRLDLLLMFLLCVTTVAGLPAVGIVMVVALLVIPPAAARLWTDRFGVLIVLAGAIGAGAGVLGTALSATLPPPPGDGAVRGWPTGALIVLVAASVFAVSALVAPRGAIATVRRSRGAMMTMEGASP